MEKKKKIFDICNIVCIALMIVVVVFHMLPSWSVTVAVEAEEPKTTEVNTSVVPENSESEAPTETETSEPETITVQKTSSLWRYVAFPVKPTGEAVTAGMEVLYGEEYNVKGIILLPFAALLCGIFAIVCLIADKKAFIPMLAAFCGSVGVVAYLGNPFYSTTCLWYIPFALCIIMLLVAIYAVYTYYSQIMGMILTAASAAVMVYLLPRQVPAYAEGTMPKVALVAVVLILVVIGQLAYLASKDKNI